MTQTEKLIKLNQYLLWEMPQHKEQAESFGDDKASQFRLFRSLVNVRMPRAASRDFLALQDEYLQTEIAGKGVTKLKDISPANGDIYLWRGDITTLAADAVVNAANSGMLGCFCPCHGCIDNAIHTFAGVQLRLACGELMSKQGHEEPTGQAKLTDAYNLPSRYVIHTVGPIVQDSPTESDRRALQGCYRSCMELALEKGLGSIAFCCISTGEFHFPNQEAAQIAVATVKDVIGRHGSGMKVIFNVFKDVDYKIYNELLKANSAPKGSA